MGLVEVGGGGRSRGVAGCGSLVLSVPLGEVLCRPLRVGCRGVALPTHPVAGPAADRLQVAVELLHHYSPT